MSLEEEIKQYEQQLEEVRIELKDEPEELKLVENEVLGLINELKQQIKQKASLTDKDSEKLQSVSEHEGQPEEINMNALEASKENHSTISIDEQNTNKPQDKAIESERIRNTGPELTSPKGDTTAKGDTSNEKANDTVKEISKEEVTKPAPDPYEANRSKWKSFSGRVTKRKPRK